MKITTEQIVSRLLQGYESIKHSVLITVFGYHSSCKHRPTCTVYTLREMKKSGTITGLWRGLRRVVTCY